MKDLHQILVDEVAPKMTMTEVELLASCPYERPRALLHSEARLGARLRKFGLLETDEGRESFRRQHRCTQLGILVAQRFARLGFLGTTAKSRWALIGQSKSVHHLLYA